MPIITTHSAMSNRGWTNTQASLGPWYQQQKLTSVISSTTNIDFGSSVDINNLGNLVIVGAENEFISGNSSQGAAYVFTDNGSTWSEQQKLTASDGTANDYFGNVVTLNSTGTVAFISASNYNFSTDSKVYAFRYNGITWSQQQILTPNDPSNISIFGKSSALNNNGNVAIIGTSVIPLAGNIIGSAYIFTYNGTTWSQQQKLTANDGAVNDLFGASVSINAAGNVAIIGSWGADISGNNDQGAAYVFTYNGTTWSQQQKLTASDGLAFDHFGVSVAINDTGNIAIIGARYDDAAGSGNTDQGSAYIFTYNGSTWSEQQKLTAFDADAADWFGENVSINTSGNTVAVTSTRNQTGPYLSAGSTYIFVYNGTSWILEQQLNPFDSGTSYTFGSGGVRLNGTGNAVIIGTPGTPFSVFGNPEGAYIFRKS